MLFQRFRRSLQCVGGMLLGFMAVTGLQADTGLSPKQMKDVMVVVNRPNNLHIIDLEREALLRTCPLPGDSAPGTVVMSPDNAIAYVLAGRFGKIWGVELASCAITFSANLSYDNVRVKSIASLAVSPDGEEIYTIHNPVRVMNDHYRVLPSQFAVYHTDAGENATPERRYPVPRQINIMATGDNGKVYLSGADVYAMDPESGKLEVAIASRNSQRPGYGKPDILTVWPIGRVSNEFIRMYTVPKFGEPGSGPEATEYFWGYERVDLTTGETAVEDFSPLEEVLFTGMHRPGHPNEFYAVLTQLKRHDVAAKKVIKSIDLERTYYCINFSTDGSKLYLAGTYNDIAVYDAESLQKLTNIHLPGGDMSMSTSQVFAAPKALLAQTAGLQNAQ